MPSATGSAAQDDEAEEEAPFGYAGQVVDQRGNPVADVTVTATYRRLHSEGRGSGFIDRVQADAQGQFSIDRKQARSGAYRSMLDDQPICLEFTHPNYLYSRIEDVRLLEPQQCRALEVRLFDGKSLGGRIVDAAGNGVNGAMVEATFGKDIEYRKATLSDGEGNFRLRGLPRVPGMLNVLANDPRSPAQTGQLAVPVARWDQLHLQVRVEPIVLPADTVVRELLGLKLVDVTESLQEAFHLPLTEGVLLFDAGANPERFGIGRIQRGDVFYVVGDRKVKNVAEFKTALLSQAENMPAADFACRVVYVFTRPDSSGTNTQYMRLTEADVAELRREPPAQ